MRLTLKCKAESITELLQKHEIIVEKVILLDSDDMNDFENDLLEDRDFIKDNVEFMYQDNNKVEHCILVMRDGGYYGIVVQSEGYHYARYSAYFEITEGFGCSIWEVYPKTKHDEIIDQDMPF
jgi:hypothetical protein